jgi:hypothetical protein
MTLEEYKSLNQATIDELAMAPDSSTLRDAKVLMVALSALEKMAKNAVAAEALHEIKLIISGPDEEGFLLNG